MAAHIICIDKESGVPIFARKLGDIPHMESPIAASLHGVRIFGRAQGVELLSTLTDNARIVWKDYHDRISLIYAGTDDTASGSELHLTRLLDNIFSAMALHVGMETLLLRPGGSLDRLRHQLRAAYPTIDKLLHVLRPGPTDNNSSTSICFFFSDLTACVDTQFQGAGSHGEAKQLLQSVLQALDVTVNHAALYSGCTVLASSPKWSEINTSDRILIGLATSAAVFNPPEESVVEIPVFLPKSDPNTPLRLVIISCSSSAPSQLRIALLCGQTPAIEVVRSAVAGVALLQNGPAVQELTLTPSRTAFNIHPRVQGFLIRNIHDRVCGWSIFPDEENGSGRIIQKFEALRVFFKNTVPDVFPWRPGDQAANSSHRAKETMWSSDFYRCHALRFGPYQLFVVYDEGISQVVMRKASAQLLRDVLKDRAIK